VHLFLIPLEPANGDSQMIFVLAKHTPFAAGAKRRNRARKIHQISKKSRVGRGPSRVGSALVGVAVAKTPARIHRCARPAHARHTCVTMPHDARPQHAPEKRGRFSERARDGTRMRGTSGSIESECSSDLRAAATGWHNHYTLGG
jgi:hypothetical protein